MTEELGYVVWEEFPRPHSMDRDDLLEALDQVNLLDYNADEREMFGDWYRSIADDVKEDVAAAMPHKVMVAEIIACAKVKTAYNKTIGRSTEVRELTRALRKQRETCEELRGTIRLMAIRIQALKKEANTGECV